MLFHTSRHAACGGTNNPREESLPLRFFSVQLRSFLHTFLPGKNGEACPGRGIGGFRLRKTESVEGRDYRLRLPPAKNAEKCRNFVKEGGKSHG